MRPAGPGDGDGVPVSPLFFTEKRFFSIYTMLRSPKRILLFKNPPETAQPLPRFQRRSAPLLHSFGLLGCPKSSFPLLDSAQPCSQNCPVLGCPKTFWFIHFLGCRAPKPQRAVLGVVPRFPQGYPQLSTKFSTQLSITVGNLWTNVDNRWISPKNPYPA